MRAYDLVVLPAYLLLAAVILFYAYVALKFGRKRGEPIFTRANLRLVPTLLFCVAMLNSAIGELIIWDAILGGTAANGKIEDGKYFLGRHGVFTEVSETVFRVSQWHGPISWGFLSISLLALLAQGIWVRRKKNFSTIASDHSSDVNRENLPK